VNAKSFQACSLPRQPLPPPVAKAWRSPLRNATNQSPPPSYSGSASSAVPSSPLVASMCFQFHLPCW